MQAYFNGIVSYALLKCLMCVSLCTVSQYSRISNKLKSEEYIEELAKENTVV